MWTTKDLTILYLGGLFLCCCSHVAEVLLIFFWQEFNRVTDEWTLLDELSPGCASPSYAEEIILWLCGPLQFYSFKVPPFQECYGDTNFQKPYHQNYLWLLPDSWIHYRQSQFLRQVAMQTQSCAWATGNSCNKLDSKFGGAILQIHSYTAVPFLGCRLVSCLFHHFFNWHCQNIIHSHLGSHVTCHTYALAESERVLCWGKSIRTSIKYTNFRQITSHPCWTVDEWRHIEVITYFSMLMFGITLSTYSEYLR